MSLAKTQNGSTDHAEEEIVMLNMNISERVVINTDSENWVASPRPGVWRKPLAREEAESGHATSIVKYEPGSSFQRHGHPLGEEILVLDGTFSDETGDYHAGTYFRNPDGFFHAPFSKEGCRILVKLHQFDIGDSQHICIETESATWEKGSGDLEVLALHSFKSESVFLMRLPEGVEIRAHKHEGGEEIYVIKGELIDEHGHYPAGTWLRNPPGSRHHPVVEQDTVIWVKTGHLAG